MGLQQLKSVEQCLHEDAASIHQQSPTTDRLRSLVGTILCRGFLYYHDRTMLTRTVARVAAPVLAARTQGTEIKVQKRNIRTILRFPQKLRPSKVESTFLFSYIFIALEWIRIGDSKLSSGKTDLLGLALSGMWI
jgi:hypothetical protein